MELYLALKAGLVADWWDWVLADDWLDLVQISRSGPQSLDGCDWWHLDPCADWWDLDPCACVSCFTSVGCLLIGS